MEKVLTIQKLLFPNGKVVVVIISETVHRCYQNFGDEAIGFQPINPKLLETGVIRGAVVEQVDI